MDFIFGLYYKYKERRVFAPSDKIVVQSAVTLARKIRIRELTSEKVVTAFIDRINQVNPLVNAIDQRFEEALNEARVIDKNIDHGNITDEEFDKKPLLVAKLSKLSSDAEVVRKLKQSGAVLLRVTNIPQLSTWFETSNFVYGTTCNPYNTVKHVGGSAGGEACLVAACGTPFGIATDVGGSIRCPAFACGVFGHKTSSTVASLDGIIRNDAMNPHMISVGPLTRYTEDIIPILNILKNDTCTQLKLDQQVDIRDVKIFYVFNPGDPGFSSFRAEVNKLMLNCVKHFSQISHHKPNLLDIKGLKDGGQLWLSLVNTSKNEIFIKELTRGEADINRVQELIKFCLGRSDFNIFIIMVLIGVLFLSNQKPIWLNQTIKTLDDRVKSALGTTGVLLYPSAPLGAGYHYTSIFRVHNIKLFSVWNTLRCCATQVPMGLSTEGVPLGIQVVAPAFQDHLTVAVAKELEKAFGGYVPPFEEE